MTIDPSIDAPPSSHPRAIADIRLVSHYLPLLSYEFIVPPDIFSSRPCSLRTARVIIDARAQPFPISTRKLPTADAVHRFAAATKPFSTTELTKTPTLLSRT